MTMASGESVSEMGADKRGRINHWTGQPAPDQLHVLKITYEVDGRVIRVLERPVTQSYVWFLVGNSSWRDY